MRRSLVVWCPQWSLVAAYQDDSLPEITPGIPAALVHKGAIAQCSKEAGEAGVRVGMKRRDAHLTCPSIVLAASDAHRDHASFQRVIIDLIACVPQHSLIAPGLVAFHARGLARFYGSEEASARMLMDAVHRSQPLATARVGIADDLFSAVIAAQHTTALYPVRAVEPGQSAVFLADMPIAVLEDEATVSLLGRLGVHTLGDFVALGVEAIRERLGTRGEEFYRLATGLGGSPLALNDAPVDTEETIDLPEPYSLTEQVAFAIRTATQQYSDRLRRAGWVCTQVRVTLSFDDATVHERTWVHPRFFSASDLVDRVRWQLDQCFRDRAGENTDFPPGLSAVRYAALDPEEAYAHEPGLWGHGPDSRVHHVLSRVQSMVGASGVLTASPRRARVAHESHALTPWGDTPPVEKNPGPLPGALPSPLPATVFSTPHTVGVIGADGAEIVVSDTAELSAQPHWLVSGSRRRKLRSWAGPWPVWEKWWDPASSRFIHRLQVVDEEGIGWLISATEAKHWHIEARYD
jgi:protein ImuB